MTEALTTTDSNPYLRDPDVQLMLRAKAGDDATFSELVSNYQSRLVSILTNLVYSQETAEDLAQDVFMRIYKSKNGYQPTAKFSTWLFRIANNLASNARRSAGRRKEVQMPGGDSSSVNTGNAAEYLVKEKSALMPARLLDKSEMQGIVLQAMEGLNERQKMAVLLHKFEDMSYADIAETMELTVPAVKSLLTRARENLRTLLEAYFR